MEYSTTNSAFTGLSRRRLDIRLYPHVLPRLTADAYRRRWRAIIEWPLPR